MFGCDKNLLLLLHKTFPAFRACSTQIVNRKSISKIHKINSGIQCLPFSITTSKSQSEKNQLEPPPFKISTQLPAVLQQQCKNWMKAALWAEQKALDAKQKWANCELKCTNIVTTTNNNSELTMSVENLTKEGKQVFMRYMKQSSSVLLSPVVKSPWQEDIVGTLRKHLSDASGQLSASIIYVKRRFTPDEQNQIKNTLFDVKRSAQQYENFLVWLKRNSEWPKLVGYNAMLCSFKCKPWPTSEEIGKDPTGWIGEEEKHFFDPSQLAALCAVKNQNRPIVAVHGAPGTGKTMLLIHDLKQFKKEKKKVFLLSSSLPALYSLIDKYQKATKDANYLILKRFNKQLAGRIVADPNIRQNMEKRSVFDNILDAIRSVKGGIIFATPSPAIIKELARRRINFDVLIVEEANAINEFETWWAALPLASNVRLYGNCDGMGRPVSSEEGRKLGFSKSLLQRLDDEFGREVNFHLQRQYRSAPAIQAWPARAFYGKRAAEPDKSVENIKMEDLLVPGAGMITDPLVLVDPNKLEGEWKNTMFEPEMGGDSFYNFCEARLVAEHLHKLFENMQQLGASQIAYFTQYESQRVWIKQIFQSFFPDQIKNLNKVRFNQLEMAGQSCEVVLQSFVTADRARQLLSDPFHLKAMASEMTRAKRQYMLFAPSKWLEEGSDESRKLLDTFRSHGRIIGPNDLFKLKDHTQIFDMKLEIMKMVAKMQYAEYKRKNPGPYK